MQAVWLSKIYKLCAIELAAEVLFVRAANEELWSAKAMGAYIRKTVKVWLIRVVLFLYKIVICVLSCVMLLASCCWTQSNYDDYSIEVGWDSLHPLQHQKSYRKHSTKARRHRTVRAGSRIRAGGCDFTLNGQTFFSEANLRWPFAAVNVNYETLINV